MVDYVRRPLRGITRARRLKGWSQAQLAEELEVDKESVSRWERGVRRPSVEILDQISGKLEAPVDELLARLEPSDLAAVSAEKGGVTTLRSSDIDSS